MRISKHLSLKQTVKQDVNILSPPTLFKKYGKSVWIPIIFFCQTLLNNKKEKEKSLMCFRDYLPTRYITVQFKCEQSSLKQFKISVGSILYQSLLLYHLELGNYVKSDPTQLSYRSTSGLLSFRLDSPMRWFRLDIPFQRIR